jgi:hypothetical protein
MKVTKWSINSGELHVSEQSQTQDTPKAEATSAAPDAGKIESPAIAPDHEAPKADAPKVDPPKIETARSEAPKIEASKASAPGTAGKMLIMAPGNRGWRAEGGVKADAEPAPARRRFGAMAAVVTLAIIAGAAGGAFATMGAMHTADAAATAPAPASAALEAAIARIDADVQQLKSGLDHTSRTALTQFNKTSDRLEKIEKAQAEPTARLAKLSEAIEKLRTTPAPAPAPVVAAAAPAAVAPAAPKDVTGSVTPPAIAVAAAPAAPASATAPATPPNPEVGRLPTVEGWTLADVGYGGALIRNRRGTFEVYAGDHIPGLGRIDAIRKQDGHWVVVTEKGLIVARQ